MLEERREGKLEARREEVNRHSGKNPRQAGWHNYLGE
jgi:hypothetical protein